LDVAEDQERCPPEGTEQRPFLDHLEVDIEVVAEPDAGQQFVGLLEEVHRA
jgi:hypothetical protein